MPISDESAEHINNTLKRVTPKTIEAITRQEVGRSNEIRRGKLANDLLDHDVETVVDGVHSLTSTMKFPDLMLLYMVLGRMIEEVLTPSTDGVIIILG